MIALLAAIPASIRQAFLGVVIGFTCFMAGAWHGSKIETAQVEARSAQATIIQLRERGLIDGSVQKVPDCDLARELNALVMCE